MTMYLRKLQPVILSFIFMCGTAALFGWLWYGVIGFGDNLRERMQTIANENAFDEQFNALLSMVEETAEERESLQAYVLKDDRDTIALLSRFDDIAEAHNVELATSQLTVVESGGNFNDLSVSYSIQGGEREVTNVIKMFETLPYHGHITALAFQRNINEESGAVNINANISLQLSIIKYDQ